MDATRHQDAQVRIAVHVIHHLHAKAQIVAVIHPQDAKLQEAQIVVRPWVPQGIAESTAIPTS